MCATDFYGGRPREVLCFFFIGGSKDRRATAAPGGRVALGPGNVWPRPLQLFGFVIGGLKDHDTFAPGGRVTQKPNDVQRGTWD